MDKNTPNPDGLLTIIQQVKECYKELPQKPKRGHPRRYPGLSFLLLAVVAVIMRTFKDRELHRMLLQDAVLREALGFEQIPHRRTIERRLLTLVPEAEAQIAALGQRIEAALPPSNEQPQVSAVDGRMYQAIGPRWHKKDRQEGVVPPALRNVDVESSWSKSGYRGWVQGYRLVLQGLVFPAAVPLFAAWRPNYEGEASILEKALSAKSLPITDVLLGDSSFGGKDLVEHYGEEGGWLLTPQQLPTLRRSWKDDLYDYRKESIELLFQRVIQVCDLKQCPVKGLHRNGAFVLANVWLYQVIFWHNLNNGLPLSKIKESVDLARWRVPL
jgi:hypothetical protein